MSVSCHLRPLDPGLEGFILPDDEEVIVGRNEKCRIVNIFCSREQLSLKANYKTKTVTVKVIGSTASCVNGKIVKHNENISAEDKSVVEVIRGTLRYEILFSMDLKRQTEHSKDKEAKYRKGRMFTWELLMNNQVLLGTTSDFNEKRNKVASFDLDGTLIITKTGNVFPKDFEDWKLWHHTVRDGLQKLDKDGWKIIIFTNQATLGTPKGKLRIGDFKKKIQNIVELLDIPVSVYISISEGFYRKPAPGMWDLMKKRVPLQEINSNESFYCGDAAGRPSNWKPGRKADFAASDRLFALNIGIKFLTPEEFFLHEKPVLYQEVNFDPRLFDDRHETFKFLPSPDQEVIVMSGSPASGKSHFVKTQLISKGYACVSRDDLGSWQKCVVALKRLLAIGKNVVIDNTNPDIASRQRYVEVCKEQNVSVRCFCMKTTLERCLHNNMFRRITDPTHAIVAPALIKTFHSSFQTPTLEEGFCEVVYIPFTPSLLSEEHKKMYYYHLVSK